VDERHDSSLAEKQHRAEVSNRKAELRKLQPDRDERRLQAAAAASNACRAFQELRHETEKWRADLARLRSHAAGIDLVDPTHQRAACSAVEKGIAKVLEELRSLNASWEAAEAHLDAVIGELQELASAAYERWYEIYHAPSEVSEGLEFLAEQNDRDHSYYCRLAELAYHREAHRESE